MSAQKNPNLCFEWRFKQGEGFRIWQDSNSLEATVDAISGPFNKREVKISILYDDGTQAEKVIGVKLAELRYKVFVQTVPEKENRGRRVIIYCEYPDNYEAEVFEKAQRLC